MGFRPFGQPFGQGNFGQPVGQPGGGSKPFSPLDIASIAGWWDISDATKTFQDTSLTTPATANNDVIGGVTDKTGLTHHLIQGTVANKPLLKTNVQNGLSVARFDHANDLLQALFTLNQPCTFIVVANLTALTAPGTDDILLSGGAATMDLVVDNRPLTQISGGGAPSVAQSVLTSWGVVSMVWDGSNKVLRENGAAIALSAGSIGTNNPGGITLGNVFGGGTTRGAAIDFGEVAVFSAALTTVQMQQVEVYFKAKWATP